MRTEVGCGRRTCPTETRHFGAKRIEPPSMSCSRVLIGDSLFFLRIQKHPMAKPYQDLTLSNRILVEHERCKGSTCQDIAQMLKVHNTTIARELLRLNSDLNGHYDHQEAHRLAHTRRSLAKSRRPKNPPQYKMHYNFH